MSIKKFFLIIIGIISGAAQAGILVSLFIIPSLAIDSIPDAASFKNSIEQFVDKFDYRSDGFINEIIIYNGTTIDKGIKSNDELDSKAVSLTKDAAS